MAYFSLVPANGSESSWLESLLYLSEQCEEITCGILPLWNHLMAYEHAPITEALIDIQASGIACGLEVLRSFESLRPGFPEVRDVRGEQFMIRTGQEPSIHQTVEFKGYQFWSADHHRVWQARTNGFTYSHLAPYESWELLRKEARSIWEEFRGRTEAVPKRLAVRFINRFDLPSKGDFADYFQTVPRIPPKLDTGLAGYLMQLVLPQRDIDATAIITQTPMPSGRPDTTSVVLDIDLYRDTHVPNDEVSIWNIFEQLRDRKNLLFEESITDKAREVIR